MHNDANDLLIIIKVKQAHPIERIKAPVW